ncbi:DUF1481 domain-containing protein [Erwinia amylovora]|nr:DUF1481 domain-containing protein [Erwinia amylovora]
MARQQRDTSGSPDSAWLEAPAGTELLMVTATDLCQSEPEEDGF